MEQDERETLNDYGIEKHGRFNYYPNAIDGSVMDMIKLCYEIIDKTELNRFAIMLSKNNTPELVFYHGMVATQQKRKTPPELRAVPPKKTFIQKLFRR
jgi:hypothetical protein